MAKNRITGAMSNKNLIMYGSSAGFEAQRGRVDAVAQAGRRRAVREYVAEGGVAEGADERGSHHAVAAVDFFDDVVRVQRAEIARPAAAGIELGVGLEQ